jgi:integrase
VLGRRAGIDRLHGHQLRHAACHYLLQNGVSPTTVDWALAWRTNTETGDDRDTWTMFLELLDARRDA